MERTERLTWPAIAISGTTLALAIALAGTLTALLAGGGANFKVR